VPESKKPLSFMGFSVFFLVRPPGLEPGTH